MNILLVTPYFVPAWSYGGPVKLVYELALQLQKSGHEVTVVTTDVLDRTHRHSESTAVLEGVRVHYFKNMSNTLAFRFNAYLPRGFRQWCRMHLQEYDVIHCHDAYTWLNVVIAREATRQGKPYFIQPHGALNATRVVARLRFAKKFFLSIFPFVLRRASGIIVSTQAEKDVEIARLDARLIAKTSVVTNGVDVSQITPPSHDPHLRQELGILPNELFILYFGRLQQIKGIDISLEALALLPDVAWKFVIVGRDEGEQAGFERQIAHHHLQDRVQFLGTVFGPRMKALLAAADVFLFTSRSEGLPMAVLDASAAGLPSILSVACNVPEIGEYGAGIVVSDNTPTQVAAALRSFAIQTPAERGHMQTRAHDVIREKFNLTLVTQQYLHLYQQAQSLTTAV